MLADIITVVNKTKQISQEPDNGGGGGINNTKAQICTHNSHSSYSFLKVSAI